MNKRAMDMCRSESLGVHAIRTTLLSFLSYAVHKALTVSALSRSQCCIEPLHPSWHLCFVQVPKLWCASGFNRTAHAAWRPATIGEQACNHETDYFVILQITRRACTAACLVEVSWL